MSHKASLRDLLARETIVTLPDVCGCVSAAEMMGFPAVHASGRQFGKQAAHAA